MNSTIIINYQIKSNNSKSSQSDTNYGDKVKTNEEHFKWKIHSGRSNPIENSLEETITTISLQIKHLKLDYLL